MHAVRPTHLRRLTVLVLPSVLCILSNRESFAAEDDGSAASKLNSVAPVAVVPESPLDPRTSLSQFALHPDLRIELVAAEPVVVDPVAIAFDARERLWVVEMRDYPNGPADGEKPKSRIRILDDRDGDGRYETATTFADELLFVTGVQPWRGGVIVTMAGSVAWMKDSTGDGKADVRETWFTGFAEQNPQLRANHPTFGLDNRVYIANGLRGGDVVARKKEWATNANPLSISGMDFRFDPLTGAYEAISGMGQFGLTFDDSGNRFVCSNRNPCDHVVLENRYIARNPNLAVAAVTSNVSPTAADSRVFPISRTWTTSTLHSGQFTAACGLSIYRGDRLPAEFRGNAFTCEPTGNLVRRAVLKPDGATFTSRPGRESIEFLASRDEWFRPVNTTTGPDGALYVVDMYRAVIEHPQFMPAELKQRPDLTLGNDRGRIWRIVPRKKSSKAVDRPRLADAKSADLVKTLEDPNAWRRETAQRMLYERQDKSVVKDLRNLARRSAAPVGRIHALWCLHGLNALDDDVLYAGLLNERAPVFEHVLRLLELRLDSDADLSKTLGRFAQDEPAGGFTPRSRFQIALSLGYARGADGDVPVDDLAAVAYREAGDPWMRTAAISSAPDHPSDLFKSYYLRITLSNEWRRPGVKEFIEQVSTVVGARMKADEIETVLFPLAGIPCLPGRGDPDDFRPVDFARLAGLGRGMSRARKSLAQYIAKLPPGDRNRLNPEFKQAAEVASSTERDAAIRRQAIDVLQYAGYETAGGVLGKLAVDGSNQSIQLAAIETLATYGEAPVASILLPKFASESPAVRSGILDAMLTSGARIGKLLDEVEAGRIRAPELGAARVNRLLRSRDKAVNSRAGKLLASAVPADRLKVLAEYQQALKLDADPVRGREVFKKTCIACHKIGDLGVDVAPDIADSRTKKPEQILTDVIDPNRAVDANYFSYTVVLTSGKTETGVITAETPTSVSLKKQEAKVVTLLRSEIEELKSNGISLMPVGLEKDVTVQQMADLISFIKNWRYLDGRIPIEPAGTSD